MIVNSSIMIHESTWNLVLFVVKSIAPETFKRFFIALPLPPLYNKPALGGVSDEVATKRDLSEIELLFFDSLWLLRVFVQ